MPDEEARVDINARIESGEAADKPPVAKPSDIPPSIPPSGMTNFPAVIGEQRTNFPAVIAKPSDIPPSVPPTGDTYQYDRYMGQADSAQTPPPQGPTTNANGTVYQQVLKPQDGTGPFAWVNPDDIEPPYNAQSARERFGGYYQSVRDTVSDAASNARQFLADRYAPIGEPGDGLIPRTGFNTYGEYQSRRAEIRESLADQYAQEDRGHLVGGSQFNKQLNRDLAEEGFITKSNWRETLTDSSVAFGLGYSVMGLGEGLAGASRALDSGRYVSPEERTRTNVEAVGPGVFGLIGTAIGAFGGVPGAIAGGMIGTGVGSMFSSTFGADEERSQSVRETSQDLGRVLGSAVDSVKKFADAIEATHAPVKQLQDALGVFGATGAGIGPGTTIPGLGLTATALGEQFNPTVSGLIGATSSNPFLAPTVGRLQKSGMRDTADLQSLPGMFAMMGDMGGATAASEALDASLQNPQYLKDKALENQYGGGSSLWGVLGSVFHGDLTNLRGAHNRIMGGESQYVAGAAATRKKAEDEKEAGRTEFADFESGTIEANKNVGIAGNQLSIISLSGGSDDDYSRAIFRLSGASAGGRTTMQKRMSDIDAQIAANPNMPDDQRRNLTNARAEAEQLSSTFEVVGVQARRSGAEREFASSTGAYDVAETSQLYGGVSAANMSEFYKRREGILQGLSTGSGPWSPAERSAFSKESREIEYRQTQSVNRQAEGEINVGMSQAGLGVAVAETYGSPDDKYSARMQQASKLLDLEKQLNDELKNGNLTYDQRLDKQRQIADTQAAYVRSSHAAMMSQFNETGDIIGNYRAGMSINSSINMSVGGNRAFDPSIISSDNADIENAQNRFNAAANPQEKAAAMRQMNEARGQKWGDEIKRDTYSPDYYTSVAQIRDEGAFQRSQMAPYMSGPDSNPFTAGLGLERQYQGILGQIRQQEKVTTNPVAQEHNIEMEQEYMTKIAGVERTRFRTLFDAIPEMIQGAPRGGAGVTSMTPAAASAFFMPSVVAGSFGPQARQPSYIQQQAEGGSSGGFAKTAMGGGGKGTDPQLAQIASLLQQLLSHVTSGGAFDSRAANDMTGPLKWALGTTFNPNQGGRR